MELRLLIESSQIKKFTLSHPLNNRISALVLGSSSSKVGLEAELRVPRVAKKVSPKTQFMEEYKKNQFKIQSRWRPLLSL
jgi:hypothetical protein